MRTDSLQIRCFSAVDATGHVVTNRYDVAGRRAALTLPDGNAYGYTYDVFGEILTINGLNGTSTWSRNDTRRLASLAFGPVPTVAGEPPTWVDYTWGATVLQRATGTTDTGIPATMFEEVFTPTDPQMPGASPLNVTDGVLSLDDELMVRRDLRVIAEEHTGGSASMNYTYDYDPAGNRSGKTNLLPTPDTFMQEYFNAANQLTGFQTVETPVDQPTIATQPGNVTTDKNGNITKLVQQLGGGDTFTWDFRFDYENRLIQARGFNTNTQEATNYEFGYDGLGRRVWTQEDAGDGSWFVYDGDQLVQERNFHSKALVVEYAWGPTATGGPASFYQNRIVSGTPQERWIYTSPQGHFPRHLFDESGALTDTFQYSSFGELVFHDGSTEVDFGWRGKMHFGTQVPLMLSLVNASIYIGSLGKRVNSGFQRESDSPMPPRSVDTSMGEIDKTSNSQMAKLILDAAKYDLDFRQQSARSIYFQRVTELAGWNDDPGEDGGGYAGPPPPTPIGPLRPPTEPGDPGWDPLAPGGGGLGGGAFHPGSLTPFVPGFGPSIGPFIPGIGSNPDPWRSGSSPGVNDCCLLGSGYLGAAHVLGTSDFECCGIQAPVSVLTLCHCLGSFHSYFYRNQSCAKRGAIPYGAPVYGNIYFLPCLSGVSVNHVCLLIPTAVYILCLRTTASIAYCTLLAKRLAAFCEAASFDLGCQPTANRQIGICT